MDWLLETLKWAIMGLPAFLIAGTIHEYMHALAARKLGDYTATSEGRLTLNPIKHIDPLGLILIIFVRFGWMKPVPINEYNFEKPVRDTAIVAAAGPLSNLAMLGITAVLIHLLIAFTSSANIVIEFVYTFLISFAWINAALTIFNLIPLPPLDGYRIVRAILPRDARYYWEMFEKYSPIVLLLIFLPFSPLSQVTTSLLLGGVNILFSILGL